MRSLDAADTVDDHGFVIVQGDGQRIGLVLTNHCFDAECMPYPENNVPGLYTLHDKALAPRQDGRVSAPSSTDSSYQLRRKGTAFSADGRTLSSGSFDGAVTLWDIPSRTRLRTLEHDADVSVVTCLSFSPDQKMLVSGLKQPVVCIWDLTSGRVASKVFNQFRVLHHRGCVLVG